LHEGTIVSDSARRLSGARNAVLAITVGGLIAGMLDLTQALILFGAKIPLAIAAGLLGPQAFRGARPPTFWGCLCTF
jgi:hypothetical protein